MAITVSAVQEGSVVIDYSLSSKVAELLTLSWSNIDDSIGENIVIGDVLVLELAENTLITSDDTESNANSSGMNTAQSEGIGILEIALIIAVVVICVLLVVVSLYIRKSKQSSKDLSTLEMTVRTRGPGSVTVSDSKYQRIIEILKECDPEDWSSYLDAFKAEKLNDETLRLFPCDAANDEEAIWKQLIPQIGVRVAFKRKWAVELEHDGHRTPGGLEITPGTATHYGTAEEKEPHIASPDTSDVDLAEPEREGNETNFGDSPVVPQMDGDPMGMAFSDIALPAAPNNVMALHGHTGGAPGNGNESDDDFEEEMYRPSIERRQTRGSSFRE